MVGFPHEIKGEGIFAFVVLKEAGKDMDRQKLVKELKKLCKERIAGYATPDHILVTNTLQTIISIKFQKNIIQFVCLLLSVS